MRRSTLQPTGIIESDGELDIAPEYDVLRVTPVANTSTQGRVTQGVNQRLRGLGGAGRDPSPIGAETVQQGSQRAIVHTYDMWESPIQDYLNQWAAIWREEGQLAAASFALSGFSTDRQARLAVCLPPDRLDPSIIKRQFDIDSIRGAIFPGDQWPFKGQLQVYPIPPPSETISGKSKYYLTLGGRAVGLHRMKNMGFGNANDKVRLRVIFPATFEETERHFDATPSAQMKEDFFDQILRPAALEIHSNSDSHWPLSWNHRRWASRLQNGQLVYQRRPIPREVAWKLIPTMHRIIQEKGRHPVLGPRIHLMRGFIIYWECQDIKLDTPFEPEFSVEANDPRSYLYQLREKAMMAAFSETDIEKLHPVHTHVDLAVEMSAPEDSVYFRDNGHAKILERVLGYTSRAAEAMVQSSSNGATYQKDRLVGLRDIAGFHLNLKDRSSPGGHLYAQAYHTEKEIGYQSSSASKIVPLRAIELLKSITEDSNRHLAWTTGALEALQSQVKEQVRNRARFEATVTLDKLETVNINFDDQLLLESLVALDKTVVPGLRFMKLRACHDVAIEIRKHTVDIRTNPAVAGLAMCLWWITTSMFGRPLQSIGGKWIAAQGHLGPGAPSEDEAYRLGQYLLTNVTIIGGHFPALIRCETPGAAVLQEIFAVKSLQDLGSLLGPRRRPIPALARGRLPVQSTAPPGHMDVEPLDNVQARIFNALEREGISFSGENEPNSAGLGRRHPEGSRSEAPMSLMPGWPLDYWAEGVMSMFGITLWRRIPNKKKDQSWLLPTEVHAAYNRYGLPEWRQPMLQIKQKFRAVKFVQSQAQWETAFRHCFPLSPDGGGWNLSSQPCREEWFRGICRVDASFRDRVVDLMRAKFNTLTAVPGVKHDKWCTSTRMDGPVLLLNPRVRPCDHDSGYLTLSEMAPGQRNR